jgi:colanic acid/amylovoran biosynthesis glycosyltransferase
MTRLAYLVSQYPAVNHTYILREIRELRALGWEVFPVSIRPDTRPPDKLTSEERDELARTWYVKSQGLTGALLAHLTTAASRPLPYLAGWRMALRLGRAEPRRTLYSLLYFTEALMAGRYLMRRQATHVHSHFSTTVGFFLPVLFPLTFSMTIHGPVEFDDAAGTYLPEKIRAAVFVSAISHYCKSQLMRSAAYADWPKIEIVRLGVNPDIFTPRPVPNGDCFTLMTAGLLTPVKGQHLLIDAVALLTRQGRRLRLRIAGDGPGRPALAAHIAALGLQNSIELTGALNQDQMRELYRATDVFVMGSLAEGVPVVLMEAMAMEIPCVAPWIMGIPELITSGVDGLLVPPADAASLAAVLAQLMDAPADRLRMGQAARAKVMRLYHLPHNMRGMGAIFERRLSSLPASSPPAPPPARE